MKGPIRFTNLLSGDAGADWMELFSDTPELVYRVLNINDYQKHYLKVISITRTQKSFKIHTLYFKKLTTELFLINENYFEKFCLI